MPPTHLKLVTPEVLPQWTYVLKNAWLALRASAACAIAQSADPTGPPGPVPATQGAVHVIA